MLERLVNKERFYYDNFGNHFASLFGQPLRYYGFLLIIRKRYTRISKRLISIYEKERSQIPKTGKPVQVTPEQWRLFAQSRRLSTQAHLEIESFYLFAKVFLDTLARCLWRYFGEARNASFKSHRSLAKHHEEYFKLKSLTIPQGLPEKIMYLKEHICVYRDKAIAHEMTLRRITATAWSSYNGIRIADGIRDPKDGDKIGTSIELTTLFDEINKYLKLVFELIQSNRDKTKLKVMPNFRLKIATSRSPIKNKSV